MGKGLLRTRSSSTFLMEMIVFVSLGHSFFKTTTLSYILESSCRQDHVNPDPCTDNVLFETNTSGPKIVSYDNDLSLEVSLQDSQTERQEIFNLPI